MGGTRGREKGGPRGQEESGDPVANGMCEIEEFEGTWEHREVLC